MGDLTINDFVAEMDARGFDGYSPTEKYRYLQWGFRDLGRMAEWRWLRTTTDLTMNPGEAGFTLTSGGQLPNLRKIRDVWITDTDKERPLQPMQPWVFEQQWRGFDLATAPSTIRGTPEFYFLSFTRLYLLPPPDVVVNTRIDYWQVAPTFSTATPDVTKLTNPADLDGAVLSFTLKWCHKRANQWDLAMMEEREAERIALDYLADQQLEMYELQDYARIPDPSWGDAFGDELWL